MTAFFLIIFGVPLVIAAAAYVFLNGITWKEFACIMVVQALVAGSSAGIVSCANTRDVEVWNGRVTRKYSEHVSCEHSYQCNCRQECSGSGKNRSCSTVCDTCYEHSYDVSWRVLDTTGEVFTIARVSRQGLVEPGRWTRVVIGEPTSSTHSYVNYVKASPGSLFRHQGLKEKYAASIPEYPQEVYDYYRLNRLVTVGTHVTDPNGWNTALSELNADLGSSKQANIIVVLIKNVPDDYFYALEESWIGGKKNDVVLVVSVDDEMKPQWASVLCWTSNELFKVKLRDDVMNDPTITKDALVADLRTNVSQHFVRKPMKDFEYLSSSITPSATEWTITLVVGLFAAIGMIIFFLANDVFGEEGSRTNSVDDFFESRRWHRNHKKRHAKSWYRRIMNTRPWENM